MKVDNNAPSKHHRKPKSRSGNGNHRNISVVPVGKHRAWHVLFSNKTPHEIAKIISEIWIDPDYEFICVRKHHV